MSDIVERLRNTPNWMREAFGSWKSAMLSYDRAPFEAADEIEKLRAALTIPKRTLELFERVASEMVSEGYAQGYREACNHIMHYMMHETMDKLGEKE
jgi:uncharacterized Zn finger protein